MTGTDLGPDSTPVPWPLLAVEELDDDLVVFDDVTGTLTRLNRQAALVWRLLDGTTSLADIGAALAEATGAPAAAVVRDVVEVARALERDGLLAVDVDAAAVEPPGP